MYLIAGLGNPGEKFKNTRHNIGREVCEAFRKKQGWPNFNFSKKFNAEISEGKIGKEKTLLACPNTFMNKSGQAVSLVAGFYKIKPENVFAIHDDSDIELGRAKLSFGRHSAGHKGVESVIKSLKTINFWRFRIGVGAKKHKEAEKIILRKFTPKETVLVKKIVKKTIEAIIETVEKGPGIAMNSYNQN